MDKKYQPTLSCMKLFSPMLQFNEMCETASFWFNQNGHYLYTDDTDGIKTITCANSDMCYNWLYVHGMIYFKMFNDAGYTTSDFISSDDGFEFKVEIPK